MRLRIAAVITLALAGCGPDSPQTAAPRPSPTETTTTPSNDYSKPVDCEVLCISDATVAAGQEVTITFAPPKEQIWGVSAELRPEGQERIGWLYGYSDDRKLKTVWPSPNTAFEDIGFYGRAEWEWTLPSRLEPGVYEISKESIREGSAPIEDRIRTWTVSFEITK